MSLVENAVISKRKRPILTIKDIQFKNARAADICRRCFYTTVNSSQVMTNYEEIGSCDRKVSRCLKHRNGKKPTRDGKKISKYRSGFAWGGDNRHW